jgi:VanZ family protein
VTPARRPMRRVRDLLLAWLPVVVWMVVILGLSGLSNLPARQNPATGEIIRPTYSLAKLTHLVEYAVLALLLLRAAMAERGGPGWSFARAALLAVVVATLFGVVDEYRQSLVPNREPRATDVLIDGLGALLAVAGVALLRGARSRLRTGLRRGAALPVAE